MKRYGDLFHRMVGFDHLIEAARRAARGKRHRADVQRFLLRLERNVLEIQRALVNGIWRPSGFREFVVVDPKPRMISAAPFADRVVHHALVAVLEPIYEPSFIYHSYACRSDKGTHRAVRQYQQWSRGRRYVLKMDVRKFFPSVDHQTLLSQLARKIKDRRVPARVRAARLLFDASRGGRGACALRCSREGEVSRKTSAGAPGTTTIQTGSAAPIATATTQTTATTTGVFVVRAPIPAGRNRRFTRASSAPWKGPGFPPVPRRAERSERRHGCCRCAETPRQARRGRIRPIRPLLVGHRPTAAGGSLVCTMMQTRCLREVVSQDRRTAPW